MMRTVLIAFSALLFVACDSGVVGDSTVVGDYHLRTINGASLPYTVGNTQILDDVISLAEAGTYIESGHSRVTVNGQVTDQPISQTGGYVLLGTSVTLYVSDGVTVRIAVIENSDKLTIVENGITKIYRK